MRQWFGASDVLSCHAEKLEASPLPCQRRQGTMSWGSGIPISKHRELTADNLAVAPRGYMVQVTDPFANALCVLGYKNSCFHSLPSACNTFLGHLSLLSQKSQSRILSY